jgi:hypothetical protein
MTIREADDLGALLEGVPLPARKRELVGYARRRDHAGLALLIGKLPEREYDSLDEVAQELVLRESHLIERDPHDPR